MTEVITEEMGIHKAWYQDAQNVKVDELSEFCNHLANDYEHDYGTICHAVAASAIAAANAINHSQHGGITGFQAGAIMWEFITHWMHEEGKPLNDGIGSGLRTDVFDKLEKERKSGQ